MDCEKQGYASLPAAWLDPLTLHSDHHVFWVIQGRATVSLEGEEIVVPAWHALWIPPGSGLVGAYTDEGTIAQSALIPASKLRDEPAAVTLRRIDQATSDALVHQFVRWIMPWWMAPFERATLERIARATSSSAVESLSQPLMPVSRSAATIAMQLLRDPSSHTPLAQWAQILGVSSRQVARQFKDETGLAFGQWRTRIRMVQVITLMRQRSSVEEIARATGYSSAASFCRAFRTTTGLGLSEARQHFCTLNCDAADPSPTEQASTGPVSGTDPEIGIDQHARSPVLKPDGVAQVVESAVSQRSFASQTMPLVNDFHVMIWMMRGTGRAELGGHTVELAEGDALWLPAWVWNTVHTDPGALLLPVGKLPSKIPLRQHHSKPMHLGREREAELLYRASVNFKRLKPYFPDTQNMRDLLPPISQRTPESPLKQALAAVLSDDLAKPTPLQKWAEQYSVSARQLSSQVEQETGLSIRQWLRERRMTVARMRLSAPRAAKVSTVARQVGYSHVSTFTQVFTEVHGVSPRVFQQKWLKREVYDDLTDE